jgi:acetyl-CoA C-acetyltransferase
MAAPGLTTTSRELNLDEEKLYVSGGAIATGHPLGATSIRLSVTLRELDCSGKRFGAASACMGGGQRIALLIENPCACSGESLPWT